MRIKRNYMYMRNDPEIHVFSYPAEYAYYLLYAYFILWTSHNYEM